MRGESPRAPMLRSFPLLLLALALPAAAQTPIAIGSYCNFDGETMEATVFGFDPDDDAEFERAVVVEPAASLENLSFLNVLLMLDEPSEEDDTVKWVLHHLPPTAFVMSART